MKINCLEDLTDFCIKNKIAKFEGYVGAEPVKLEFHAAAFVKQATLAELMKAREEQDAIDKKSAEEALFWSAT